MEGEVNLVKRKRGRPRKDEVRFAPYPAGPAAKKLCCPKKEIDDGEKDLARITKPQAGNKNVDFNVYEDDVGEAEKMAANGKKGTTKFDYLFVYGHVSFLLHRAQNTNRA